MTVATVNPATGAALATYEETTPEELDAVLDRAYAAAAVWRDTPVGERADGLRRLAAAMRERFDELALLATREMGKPLEDSRAEVEKCAWCFEWFADNGPAMLERSVVDTGAVRSFVAYVPLGVLFAIMPWNFPYWQVVRALAPALTAGNVVVLKHAPSTTGCALELADVAAQAGLPEGVFSAIVVGVERTEEVSDGVIRDPRVAAVTLTGSTRAGRSVAAVAGAALKKTVLELGGSDPFVVLADADLDAAAAWARPQPLPEHGPVVYRGQADHRRAGDRGTVPRAVPRRGRRAPHRGPRRAGGDGRAARPRRPARRARSPGRRVGRARRASPRRR